MLTIIQDIHLPVRHSAAAASAVLVFFALSASAQNATSLHTEAGDPTTKKRAITAPQPVASVYKEIKIGTSADEIRKLLGKAKIDDKDGFFYDMDSEAVQIRLDENEKVRIIAVTFTNNSPQMPKYADLFGAAPAAPNPDGSIYKLVRYPDVGYWIAYSKTAGEKPSVTVTMQKL